MMTGKIAQIELLYTSIAAINFFKSINQNF